ncbi:MAG: hypothetical protein KF708_05770 [Pirellulales bacterium]|nr:hypothetical protein [Pirellulales bacterium]
MSLDRQTAARARAARRGRIVFAAGALLACVVALPGTLRAAELSLESDERATLRDDARLRSYRHPLYYGQPRVIKYDIERDELRRNTSVTMPVPKQPKGRDVSYHGNRLKQYRFVGPQQQGGIYSALAEDKLTRELDARKYRYRWNY